MGDGEPLCILCFDFFWPAFTCRKSNHSSFDKGCIWSIITHNICMKLLQYCIWTVIISFFKKRLTLYWAKKLELSKGSLFNCFILFNPVCTNIDMSLQYLYILAPEISLVHLAKRKTVFIMLRLIDINTGYQSCSRFYFTLKIGQLKEYAWKQMEIYIVIYCTCCG